MLCIARFDNIAQFKKRDTIVQFKKREKHPWKRVTFTKVAGYGTKSRKASHVYVCWDKSGLKKYAESSNPYKLGRT